MTKKRWRDFLIAKILNLFLVVCNFFLLSRVSNILQNALLIQHEHIEAQLSQNKKGVLEEHSSVRKEREREKIHKVFQMYDESRTNVPATYSLNHVSYFLFYFFVRLLCLTQKNLQYNNLIFFFFFFSYFSPSCFDSPPQFFFLINFCCFRSVSSWFVFWLSNFN